MACGRHCIPGSSTDSPRRRRGKWEVDPGSPAPKEPEKTRSRRAVLTSSSVSPPFLGTGYPGLRGLLNWGGARAARIRAARGTRSGRPGECRRPETGSPASELNLKALRLQGSPGGGKGRLGYKGKVPSGKRQTGGELLGRPRRKGAQMRGETAQLQTYQS